MHRRRDDIFSSKNIYLYFNPRLKKLVATQSDNGIGIPFICTPNTKSDIESSIIYPSHNLYNIIQVGGIELYPEQIEILNKYKDRLIKRNHSTDQHPSLLTREDIHNILVEFNRHITKEQLEIISQNKGIKNTL